MKLVLISGGNIGKSGTLYETGLIDEEIVKLANKEHPNFLFIGIASDFSDSYYKLLKEIYNNLGCNTEKISTKTLKNYDVVVEKIKRADIIYVGSGDTLKLYNMIKEYKLDNLLNDALNRDCVLTGMSAGAIIWCNHGLSDTEIVNNISDNYVVVNGLNYVNCMFVPHFDQDVKRKKSLFKLMDSSQLVYCMDNCTALEIVNNSYKIIKSKKNAKAYLASKENNTVILKEIY